MQWDIKTIGKRRSKRRTRNNNKAIEKRYIKQN